MLAHVGAAAPGWAYLGPGSVVFGVTDGRGVLRVLVAGPVTVAWLCGQGAGSARSDWLAVDDGHRHDLAGCRGDQHFSRLAQVIGGQRALLEWLGDSWNLLVPTTVVISALPRPEFMALWL